MKVTDEKEERNRFKLYIPDSHWIFHSSRVPFPLISKYNDSGPGIIPCRAFLRVPREVCLPHAPLHLNWLTPNYFWPSSPPFHDAKLYKPVLWFYFKTVIKELWFRKGHFNLIQSVEFISNPLDSPCHRNSLPFTTINLSSAKICHWTPVYIWSVCRVCSRTEKGREALIFFFMDFCAPIRCYLPKPT